MDELKKNYIFDKIQNPIFWERLSNNNNNYIKNIVYPVFVNYKNDLNYSNDTYMITKRLVELIDLLCATFGMFINTIDNEDYKDQMCSLTFISICLEQIVKLVPFENKLIKLKVLDLLDFRQVSNITIIDNKKIYENYLNKCLIIVIEFMISMNILSSDKRHQYLSISDMSFVQI
jgi:hypothetical protein